MPNHCENILGVAGTEKEVLDFIQFVSRTKGDGSVNYEIFSSLLPMPEELQNAQKTFKPSDELPIEEANRSAYLIEKYGFDNWYDWANSKWGTKWGDYETVLDGPHIANNYDKEPYHYCHFSYSTAWGPGEECLSDMLISYSSSMAFHLYYCEPGMGFHGEMTVVRGEVVNQSHSEYRGYDKDIVDAMFNHEWL